MKYMLMTACDVAKWFNELLEVDHDALPLLLTTPVPCNEDLAMHPYVQVSEEGDEYVVRGLGLLNGLLLQSGSDEVVARVHDETGRLIRFEARNYKEMCYEHG